METGRYGWGERQLSRLLAVCGFALFGWMLAYAYQNTANFFESAGTIVLLGIVALAVSVLLAFVLGRYAGRAVSLTVIVLLAAGLRLLWVLNADTPPVSDFLDMHEAALSAAAGDFSFGTNEYFTRWTYQIGFALYEALVIKLFGPSLLVLQSFQILFQLGTLLVIYGMAVRAFGETSAKGAALLYALYVPNILMCSVLTNQHISVFFYVLGLFVVMRRRFSGKTDWLLAGLCFGLANLMRPLGSFFLVGFIVYAVLFLLVPGIRERRWPALAAKCVGLLAVYWLVQQAAGAALVQTGVTPYPLESREPYWKFVVGLNPATNGGWSYDDTVLVQQVPIGEERNRLELELVKERLADKRQVAALLVSKAKTMWGGDDSAPMWSMPDQDRPELRGKLIRSERIEYVLLAFLGLVAATLIAVRGASAEASLLVLLLLGYAALHLVIEVQTRYRYDIFPCVFILAGFGLSVLAGGFRRKPPDVSTSEPVS
ncbi:ArnT family glycosyltransferase [Paenibacillus hodogayensis]|uniref:ArnT family glycosyltransferase n=1 Tax=Paenibacillus hodogayensis TaxID=279208 RepID=A0ABV5W1J1_9BACL